MKLGLKKKVLFKNLVLLCAGVFILFSGIIVIWLSTIRIPDFNSFDERKIASSTKIYDRTGKVLLYDIHQNVKRTIIPFEEMGINIKNATVAVEDADFYNHSGIRITSIFRAVLSNIFNINNTQGGSTITQQLIKNTLLNSKKTISRKIKEWVLAVKIDKSMPKEKILELYLNESPYGGNIYGIEEAAKKYFGKNAMDLGLAEAAYLAALPQAPTTLSPYGKNRNKLEERKNFVLSRMKDLGVITVEEYETVKKEIVVFLPQETEGLKAPHFLFFIKDYLEEKYGADVVLNGGLNVITTLDYDLQQKAEKIVKEGALQNEKDWGGSNAALVAIDPKTGHIITMVGSRDYFDKAIDSNYNVAIAHRQPGSSFKPFIYATAFSKGFTPESVLFDLQTEFSTTCNVYGKARPGRNQDTCYMPNNYDDKYRGPINLRNALAQSINIPAVQLFYLAGIKDSFRMAQDLGISTLTDTGRYGLTLVIGGGEVTLLDMTSAYSVFANSGMKNPYTGILKVEDRTGNVLEEYSLKSREVLQKNIALTISDILSDNVARTPTFGAHSALLVPGKNVAVKTGTTNSNRDAWIIGYTPSIAVGVWAGNNDNTPMKKGGAALAGPIWNKFITEALQNMPDEKFEKPNLETDPETVKPVLRGFWQGNEQIFIDRISGKLATDQTPKETKEERIITNVRSILYWVDKKDILGPPPSNPEDDSLFEHFEIPVQNWWANNRYNYPVVTASQIPQQIDDVHNEESKPKVLIKNPDPNIYYLSDQNIILQIDSSGRFPLQKIDIFINNIYLSTIKYPFAFSFTPSELDNLKEINELKIISYDTAWNRSETVSVFNVSM